MTKSKKYSVNTSKVVAETIDGEVVIINLEKGDYYSLVKSGAEIWGRIENGLTHERIVKQMIQQYDDAEENIIRNVSGFIDILENEGLIIVESIDENREQADDLGTENINNQKLEFDLPTLEKYTDMEELLLLDPIHQVDEKAGWPAVKQ